MDEDHFNMAVRKFLKQVGVTSQREIEKVVREGKVDGPALKLRMTLTAENAPLEHVVVHDIVLQNEPVISQDLMLDRPGEVSRLA